MIDKQLLTFVPCPGTFLLQIKLFVRSLSIIFMKSINFELLFVPKITDLNGCVKFLIADSYSAVARYGNAAVMKYVWRGRVESQKVEQ